MDMGCPRQAGVLAILCCKVVMAAVRFLEVATHVHLCVVSVRLPLAHKFLEQLIDVGLVLAARAAGFPAWLELVRIALRDALCTACAVGVFSHFTLARDSVCLQAQNLTNGLRHYLLFNLIETMG